MTTYAPANRENNRYTPDMFMPDFDTQDAKRKFIHDATKVANNICKDLGNGECEVVSLFVNKETGHVRIWCHEGDPIAALLSFRDDTSFREVFWQVRGGGIS